MSRPRKPDSKLSPEQLRKRQYNERYRKKKNIPVMVREKRTRKRNRFEKEDIISQNRKARFEKSPPIFAMANNNSGGPGDGGNFSNPPSQMNGDDFSNVIHLRNFSNRSGGDLRNQDQQFLLNEIARLEEEISKLKDEKRPTWFRTAVGKIAHTIATVCKTLIGVLVIGALATFLVWQGSELAELSGNKHSLWLMLGLEFSAIVAAAGSALAMKRSGKFIGVLLVLGFTGVMATYMVTGLQKRSVIGSAEYQRVEDERKLALQGIEVLNEQLRSLPPDYQTRRAGLLQQIDAKTEGLARIDTKLSALNTGSGTNPYELFANIAARILVMLLEAWIVHWIFASKNSTKTLRKAA